MLAPERMPIAEGKKMANIWKKLPSGALGSGFRFDSKMSPDDREQKTCNCPHIVQNQWNSVCLEFDKILTLQYILLNSKPSVLGQ